MGHIITPMYVPCPKCGIVRTLRVQLTPSGIGYSLMSRCRRCSQLGSNHPHQGSISTTTDLAEEIRWMNVDPELAAKRLGTTPGAIARRLYRAGMPVQARPFGRADMANRKRRTAA